MKESDDESHAPWTDEQAVKEARLNAKRDLIESGSVISYVAFVPDFEDYCHCELRFEPSRGWLLSCRVLAQQERAPDERITEDRVVALASAGKLMGAIRLYRGLYGVGLTEGRAGVERLLRERQ